MMQSRGRLGTRGDAGFSLMEAMIALLVLTIGLMSMAVLMANVYKSTVRSRYMSLAAALTSEKLEDLSSYGLADPRAHLPGGSLTANAAPVTSGTVAVDYYDVVVLDNSSGAMSESYQILNGTSTQFVTQTFTADGMPHWDSSGFPSAPTNSTPPGETFIRRWVIEKDAPATGLYTITVLVTTITDTDTASNPTPAFQSTPAVTFQMSTVRP